MDLRIQSGIQFFPPQLGADVSSWNGCIAGDDCRSAASLDDVVDFYDTHFKIGLTARERADLIAFLTVL